MGSAKSASGNTKRYNHNGTIYAVLRAGPIDTIDAIFVDGLAIWEGPVNRTDGGVSNPYEFTLTDSKWLRPDGYIKLHWGDESQTADGAQSGHPPYRGFAYIVFHKFLFGTEVTTAPNVEILARACPRPPASVISSTSLFNGQANPWAVAADLITSVHGMELSENYFDATSWQTVHDAFASDSDLQALAYCSPLLTSRKAAKEFFDRLRMLTDGWMRWTAAGTIEAGYYTTDPGDLALLCTLTENDFLAPPDVDAASWESGTPTGLAVQYEDADQLYKSRGFSHPDLLALQFASEPNLETLDLTNLVTDTGQARRLAAENAKRVCRPKITGQVQVRPEKAVHPAGHPSAGEAIRPGDRFILDLDTEPGGSGTGRICRLNDRRFGPTGGLTLRFEIEPNQAAIPFLPTYTPPALSDIVAANVSTAFILPLPPSQTDNVPSVAVLADRPSDYTTGAKVLFDVADGAGTFYQIGEQIGFAVRAQLAADYSATDSGAIRVELLSTRDEHLALQDIGDSAAADDSLLLIVYRLSGSYLEEDANGQPSLEFFSISTYAAVSGDTYDFTALRSRLGTNALAWSTSDPCWIIPRSSLEAFTHSSFGGKVIDASAFNIRLRGFNRWNDYDGSLSDFPVQFPSGYSFSPAVTFTTPSGSSGTANSSGNYTPAGSVKDYNKNLVRVEMFHRRDGYAISTTILDVSFSETAELTFANLYDLANVSTPINFPQEDYADRVYNLTVRAHDSEGNTEESTVQILSPAAISSTTPPPIEFDPPSGWLHGTVTHTLTASGSATEIHYAIQNSPTESPPTSYNVAASTTKSFTYNWSYGNFLKFWARASDGTNHSAWGFATYNGT